MYPGEIAQSKKIASTIVYDGGIFFRTGWR